MRAGDEKLTSNEQWPNREEKSVSNAQYCMCNMYAKSHAVEMQIPRVYMHATCTAMIQGLWTINCIPSA